jgi:hypothetical protein
MYSNSSQLSANILLKILGVWIVILMLLVPALSIYSAPADLESNSGVTDTVNPDSQISNLPKITFDYTVDGLSLFLPSEQADFQGFLGNLGFSVSSDFSSQDIHYLPNTNNNPLITSGTNFKTRTLNNPEIGIQHTVERISSAELVANTDLGIKQSVELFNPTLKSREYFITFSMISHQTEIRWDSQIIPLTETPLKLSTPPYEVAFLGDLGLPLGHYNWNDLVAMGLQPTTSIYQADDKGIIECTIHLTLAPHEKIYLDPQVFLDNISHVKMFNEEEWATMGKALAVGDFNNDSYDDIVIPAPSLLTGPSGDKFGELYMVFGKPQYMFQSELNFSYSEDIKILGPSTEEYTLDEVTLATGDINNDGIEDLVIGTQAANFEKGEVYAIFGRDDFGKKLFDLASTVDYDVKIIGPQESGRTGASVAVGDVNGDGFGDIIVGSPFATYIPDGILRENCGLIHVVYGNTSMPKSVHLGVKDHYDVMIVGESLEDQMGKSLASGDMNNDGIDDIAIGSPFKDSGMIRKRTNSGQVDVIFGRDNFTKEWDMRIYHNDTLREKGKVNSNITILGQTLDEIGYSLAISDFDGDNFDDLFIGSPLAHGKTGFGTEIGEVYIYYGDTAENYPPLYDVNNISRDGYVIWGKDSGDNFGASLNINNLIGDGNPDILIGAPGARGISDDSDRTGEVYIIPGSGEKKFGSLDDLWGTKGIWILYGKNKGEQVGYAVSSGDINNDSVQDLVIGTPTSSNKNGSLFDVGRVDIVFELIDIDTPIHHLNIELLDGGGSNGTICYAGFEHTFKARVRHSLGIEHLNFTQLSLEPIGPNIQFRWYQQNNTFFEVSDRFGYASINAKSSTAKKISDTTYELNFKIIIDFKYPPHKLSSAQLYSLGYNLSVPAAINRYNDIYKVENDLDFIGNLKATGSYQGVLAKGDKVHTDENIIWSGLKVVYNGTTNRYPPNKYFDVTVWDDEGNSWIDRSSSGSSIEIESKADSNADLSDIHTVNITNIPDYGIGLSEKKFEIKVEDTKILFKNPVPDETIWHDTTDIKCKVSINDSAGWNINGSSIEYSISSTGFAPENFGPWTSAGLTGTQMIYIPEVDCKFANGENNYIRWRAKNVASPLYSGSEVLKVLVDIEPVEYQNPVPDEITWSYSESVTFSVTVFDNLSGADDSSIEYRFKSTGKLDFGTWTKSGLSTNIIDEKTVSCSVDLTFKAGVENYVQFRAKDVLGNSDLGSQEFRIKITTDKPISILKSPPDGSILKSITVPLTWEGSDPEGDDITYDVYFSSEIAKVTSQDTTVKVISGLSKTSYNITALENNGKYYWTVIPSDGISLGECQDGIWSFEVRLNAPVAELVLPGSEAILSSTSTEFLWDLKYNGLEKAKYDLYLGTSNPPTAVIASDLSVNAYQYNDLEDGETYYWYVIPKVETLTELIMGNATPIVSKFSVDSKVIAPAVNLKTPKDNEIFTDINPSFTWELVYSGPKTSGFSYMLLLDTRPNPANVIFSDLSVTEYNPIAELANDKTYYWRVIPFVDNIQGRCLSGIWSFKKVSIFPEFNITLELDTTDHKVSPGQEIRVEFSVTNLGTANDTIVITFQSAEIDKNDISIDQNLFLLPSHGFDTGIMTISIPKSIDYKSYTITITASSQGAIDFDEDVKVSKDIQIEVVEKDSADGLEFLGVLITFIVVVVILILLYIVMRSKKSPKKPEEIKAKEKDSAKPAKIEKVAPQKLKSLNLDAKPDKAGKTRSITKTKTRSKTRSTANRIKKTGKAK